MIRSFSVAVIWRAHLTVISLVLSVPLGLVIQSAHAATPYLQLVPETAFTGQQVTAYGSGFCGTSGCSVVTIKVADRVAASKVSVRADGRFQTSFTVTENSGHYTVTASQVVTDGSTLQASAPLILPATDLSPEATSSPTISSPPQVQAIPGQPSHSDSPPPTTWWLVGIAVILLFLAAGAAVRWRLMRRPGS
jgi:hypothetical protein